MIRFKHLLQLQALALALALSSCDAAKSNKRGISKSGDGSGVSKSGDGSGISKSEDGSKVGESSQTTQPDSKLPTKEQPVLTDPPPGATELTQFIPEKNNAAFRNPGKGWVVYDFAPASSGAIDSNTPLASLVYSNYFSWGDLEPTEGGYDFSPIDNLISKTLPGQKVGIAISVLDPTSRPNLGARGYGQVPGWLVQKMGAAGGTWVSKVYGIDVRKGGADTGYVFAPNYYNWYFLDAHKKLLQALAARYASTNPAQKNWRGVLEMIEISTFGAWGEWHQTEYQWPGANAQQQATLQQQTLVQMIDDYFNAFASYPEIKFEISGVVDRVNPANAVGPAYDLTGIYHALSRGATVARKFIGAKESLYVMPYELDLLTNRPTTNPLRLEWGAWDGAIFDFYDRVDTSYRQTLHYAVQRALEFRTSYLGWHVKQETIYCSSGSFNYNSCSYCGPIYSSSYICPSHVFAGRTAKVIDPLGMLTVTTPSETLRDYAQKQSGYRFELTKVEYLRKRAKSDNLDIKFTLNQVAVAKLYQSYKLKFWLAQPGQADLDLGQVDFTANTWPTGLNMNKQLDLKGLKIPANAKSGWYKLKFAIVDNLGQPAMNFAIKGKDIDDENLYGKYFVGDIYID